VTVRAVIAVRGGAEAKSRCAPSLDADARAELVRAMLEDMIAALAASPAIDAIEVVTPTPELARVAREAGATGWLEPAPRGINAAFEAARARLAAADSQAVMVALPGDLPMLDAAELAPAFAQLGPCRVVLVPATADGGTGAVVVAAATPFAFAFGPDSFQRHWSGAERDGLHPIRLEAPSLGLDIDRPQDLAAAQRRNPAGRTARVLAERLRPTEVLS
jgi:2-phospho-L-lactate guanylyltransferase